MTAIRGRRTRGTVVALVASVMALAAVAVLGVVGVVGHHTDRGVTIRSGGGPKPTGGVDIFGERGGELQFAGGGDGREGEC